MLTESIKIGRKFNAGIKLRNQPGAQGNNNIKSPDNITNNITFDSIDKAFIGIEGILRANCILHKRY